MVGRHRRQRPLARAGRVGVAADQAVGVGRGGPRGEIVELVVEQHAGALGDQADAVAEVERVGVGDGVAVAVDHREMRGVVALARQRMSARISRDGVARVGIDAGAKLRGVALRHQPRQRRAHHRRIAEIGGAVGIGAPHRLDHQVQPRGVVLLVELVAFEDVEHLDQHDAARRRRRHRDDLVAAIAAAHRPAHMRAIVLEVVRGHDAAGGLHRGGELLGDRTLVECARPALRDRFQRVGEVALHQQVAGAERIAVGLEEDLRRGRPARQPRARRAAASSAMSSSTAKPSRASAIAGAISSASVRRPEPKR